MDNPKYLKGEVMDVTFKNVTVRQGMSSLDDGREFFVITDPQRGTAMYVNPNDENVTIVRKAPADGMPEVGDVWQDRDGMQWFAAAHYPDVDAPMDELADTNKDGWYLVLVPNQLGEAGYPRRLEEVINLYGPIRRLFRPTAAVPTGDAQGI